jgi:FkbM family methyltransferase
MAKKMMLGVHAVRRRQITVGGTPYRYRGYLLFPSGFYERPADWEPELDNILQAALRCHEGAFLDVGAHVGQTMLKVLAIENTRQYVGFEPQVICTSAIQKFIQDNGLTNYTILPIGLSTENKVIKLFMASDEFDSTASMVEGFRPDSFYNAHQYVCVRNGDEIAAELGLQSVAVIKIDVEGGELEVIEGLSNTIQKHKPFIVFEVLNFYLTVTNQPLPEPSVRFRKNRIERMEAMLRRFGYQIHGIVPEGPTMVGKIQPESTADQTRTNYVAVPSEGRDRFFAELSNIRPLACS